MRRGRDQAGLALLDDLDAAVAVYNDAAGRMRWPRVQVVNPARRMALQSRLRDCGGLEGWRHAMARAEAGFLAGVAWMSFDWITQSANFIKLMEGNYDNPQRSGRQAAGPAHADDALRDRIHDAARYRRPSRGDCF